MRNKLLLILSFLFAVSNCLGETASWRCANGQACNYTAGVGYHCPGVKFVSNVKSISSSPMHCAKCRGSKSVVQSGMRTAPVAGLACSGCTCRFVIAGHRVPVSHSTMHSIVITYHIAVLFPPTASSVISSALFAAISLRIANGPPRPVSSPLLTSSPFRAPPVPLT